MKTVFMGSAAFAVPSLKALLKSPHKVALVVCQPDKPAGRGLKIQACPVAEFARQNKLEVFQPKSLRSPEALNHLQKIKPDLIVVVAYGKLLPKQILDLPPQGCVNVHASLLPQYRGAAPINWAIVRGEKTTGVTTMHINEQMDAGDILLQESTAIDPEETSMELHDRLSTLGAGLLIITISRLEKKNITPRPQDESRVSFAPLINKEDGRINWERMAAEIKNLIRGMQPWPTAYTFLNGQTWRIFKALATLEHHEKKPGTVVIANDELGIATGGGTLYPLEVQLEGKKRMAINEFLRGHKITNGLVLDEVGKK